MRCSVVFWVLLGACGGGDPTPCAERMPFACETDELCRVVDGVGLMVDEAGEDCLSFEAGWTDLGCIDADLDCLTVEIVAADDDGVGWWFPDSCVPDGWVVEAGTIGECP